MLLSMRRASVSGIDQALRRLGYTPDTLAERWACSGETVRQLVKRGALRGFRVGRMIRITRDAVEEYERCQTSKSDDCAAVSALTGPDMTESEPAISLSHARERARKQRP
jgi:excisionase family DNA binding protein